MLSISAIIKEKIVLARFWAGWVLAGLFLCAATMASAHARGENYVWVNVEKDTLSGRVEISFEDLENAFGFNLPEDPGGREMALREHAEEIQRYILNNLSFIVDGEPVSYSFGPPGLAPGAERRFASFPFVSEPIGTPDEITIWNNLLLSWNTPLFRSLAVMEYDRQRAVEYPVDYAVLSFGPHKREDVLNLTDPQPVLTPEQFIWQGIIHILLGPDHVLFLLVLLLTTVLRQQSGAGWVAVDRFGQALWQAILVVTLFALSHSVTLSLTVLGLIQPNIAFVETLIAFSIVLVAVNSLYPVFNIGKWILIVLFGLFHGMGFASAMSDLQFRLVEPAKILFNFNLGIEIGQIAIVVLLLPILYLIRRTQFFKRAVFFGGNVLIALIAGYWTITRAFEI